MMDHDGKFTYSKIFYITINADGKHIAIYPNPAHNYFVIGNGNMDLKNANVVVRDMTGRMVISQKLNNNNVQAINIASLSKGLYMVSIDVAGNRYMQKLLVQ